MQTNRITQNYWNQYRVEPIRPAAKVRLETEQEKHLRDFIEARRRERRLTMVPKTDTREEIEMFNLEVKIMDWFGKTVGVMVLTLSLWFVGAVITAIRTGW